MHSDETKIYTALLIAAAILGLILVFFIITLFRQQKKHWQLHQQKINAEIVTLENERKRVARDLHDEIAMTLSLARLELSGIEETLPANTLLLSRASGHIEESLAKIREITRDLMPAALERRGLLAALEELFHTISDVHKVPVEYVLPAEEIQFSGLAQTHLYRVVQEIMHNSLKHACASKIVFIFKQEKKCIRISVSDNGKGFNREKMIKTHTGLGLHNILSRVEMLNGDMYLDSAEGKGVCYSIEIPLTTVL